ncbi:MAG TPA: 2,3-bisphosphoglycerate-independent phosphoglycerate mutase [Stellaceae bacterium]|nr:2,3-bisphosphoglycerate-independent phosphoglycerate mutase [Stellaceae bacterium]
MPNRPRPVVLCILDGWGERADRTDNAILLAKTPNWDRLLARSPHAHMEASELHVGLPAGQMGNSEVGHMNLGAGRVVMQDLPRIDAAVSEGTLARAAALEAFIAALKRSGGTAHLLGLVSPGGVHSHQAHLAALARCLDAAGVPVLIHMFLDGRDTPPRSAKNHVAAFIADIAPQQRVRLATLGGRYFAMDRDKRWDRIEKAYRALVQGEGEHGTDPLAVIADSYAKNVGDEFVPPTLIGSYRGMADGDGLLMGNFRADRVRQILTALLDPAFAAFERGHVVRFAAATGLTEYSTELARFMTALFPPEELTETFGEIIARAGLTQLRLAETEKYAHVTFFFNGGREETFAGESRILVPSPKVATYDLKPEMSAPEVTDALVAAIDQEKFDVIVVNFANADMVGHTGDLAAAITAVETIDTCLGRVASALQRVGGTMLVTADHGNVEMMRDEATGQAHTAHTTNPVPLVLVNPPSGIPALADGKLADIAPTLLALLQVPQPRAMTGRSLLRVAARATA